jgi:hypothetical protein
MKSQCKTCGKNCEGEYCFLHKPRKPLNVAKKSTFNRKPSDKSEKNQQMREFFLNIWKRRLHISEVSGTYLGKEPLTVFFHHILPKEKYPQAKYDEENIILLTLDEHTNVESDIYKYEEVNKRRNLLKIKYEGT